MSKHRDKNILIHIVEYCTQIEETVDHFGNDYSIFASNNIYRNACCLCLLQIGELTYSLSDEFKAAHAGVPWKQIRGFRNIVAHAYGTIEPPVLWEIISSDILVLKNYCQNLIDNFLNN